jgi:hypothetical protein
MIQSDRARKKSGFAVDGGPSPKAGEKAAFIFRETSSDRQRSSLEAETKSPKEKIRGLK